MSVRDVAEVKKILLVQALIEGCMLQSSRRTRGDGIANSPQTRGM